MAAWGHQIQQPEEPFAVSSVDFDHLAGLEHAVAVRVELLKRDGNLLLPRRALGSVIGCEVDFSTAHHGTDAGLAVFLHMAWGVHSCVRVQVLQPAPRLRPGNQRRTHLRVVSAPLARITARDVCPGRPTQRGTFLPFGSLCSGCTCCATSQPDAS